MSASSVRLAGDLESPRRKASTQAPPDLPSFIFKERIVYLVCINIFLDIVLVLDIVRSTNHLQGMTLVPSVTELIPRRTPVSPI